jgi:hypothetical protein
MTARLLTGALILTLCFSCCRFTSPVVKNTGPEVITLEADLGPVLFQHRKHQQHAGENCIVCHHRGSGKTPACRSCHKKRADTKEGDPAAFYAVKMDLCRGCHQKAREDETSRTAPVDCNKCHDTKKIKWKK